MDREIVCLNCQRTKRADRYWQRFCSPKCRGEFHKKERAEALRIFRETKAQVQP